MEQLLANYGIEIVVGMVASVLIVIAFRIIYFSYSKKNNDNG
tara:strand:- start:274 stop:399 length:126 start_codon:yes stop_codon:yes gene_type:complete